VNYFLWFYILYTESLTEGVRMKDKEPLDVNESLPLDVKIDELYDKVVYFLSSEGDDSFVPDMWDVADNPELMKLDEAPRCV